MVTNRVRATVHNISQSGKLIDQAVQAGANSIEGISFGVEDRGELEKRAMRQAMRRAEEKASQLARLGGVDLGELISISEGDASPRPVETARQGGAGASPPIEAGRVEVQVRVQVTYATK